MYICVCVILWCNTVTLLSPNGSLTFLWKRIHRLTNGPRIGRLAQASPQRTLLQQQQHFNGYSTIRAGREIISALQRCVLSVTTVALQHRQTLGGILTLERALATSVGRAGQSQGRGVLNRRMVSIRVETRMQQTEDFSRFLCNCTETKRVNIAP